MFSGELFGIKMSCKIDALKKDYSTLMDWKFRADGAEKWIDEWRKLFPPGISDHINRSYRGSKNLCLVKMKKFKSPPKRFHPRGLAILYEDHDILVVNKSGGLLTVSNEKSPR